MSLGPGTTSTISAGATVSPNVVDGGILIDYGTAVSNSITSGGTFSIETGGIGSVTNISSGGGSAATVTVFAGGLSISAVVGVGGDLDVNGTAEFTDVSGGVMNVSAGGGATITLVESGGFVQVLSEGQISDTSILSGGVVTVLSSGTTISTSIMDGGIENVSAGGYTSSDTVSGIATLSNGVLSHTAFDRISSGGVAVGAKAKTGGVVQVFSSGLTSNSVVSGTTIVSGGVLFALAAEVVSSGGIAISSVIDSGGQIDVRAGGVLSGSLLSGSISAIAAGRNSATSYEIVSSGGVAIDEIVAGGGAIYVRSGGVTSGVTLTGSRSGFSFASYENVNNGGTASNTVVGNTNFLNISAGGSGVGTFLAGGGSATFVPGVSVANVPGGKIDLLSLDFVSGGTAAFDYALDVLTITEGGVTSSLSFSGDYTGDTFHISQDFGRGTLVTQDDTVACYCKGTHILTEFGEVPVEALAIGDYVMTVTGVTAPIRWIGRRNYVARFMAGQQRLLPIRITRGALGEGLPRRDLLVSPEHAMFLDGVLVPAGLLLNETTIIQWRECEHVDYFHIEFAQHEVIFAEGAPSETFLDDDSRGMFQNALEFVALYPDAPDPGSFYAPRVTDGYKLEVIRQRLATVAEALASKAAA